ncbi:unnamed protein product [Linum tenue]|uniref:Uncharacterized protein n=1 Tax=Linum tenue TaxID=586396 RepID=A0AAV0I918_9ROSI|nr:unnamed protein product [Linum tenue]
MEPQYQCGSSQSVIPRTTCICFWTSNLYGTHFHFLFH